MFMIPKQPVMPVMPSSVRTTGAAMSGNEGPAVLKLTISLPVPGSLPWHTLITPPTVRMISPIIFVRIGESLSPSDTVPTSGYGIGAIVTGGGTGVRHTLTAMPTQVCPEPFVTTSSPSTVTFAMNA